MKSKYSFPHLGLKLFALAHVLVCPQLVKAADIDIKKSFPDPTVQETLLSSSYDWNTDGILSDEEQANITSLYLGGGPVKDVTGVKLLTALTSLDISGNSDLTTADLSGLVNLEFLYTSSCGLTSLNLTGLKKLRSLSVNGNPALTAINVKGLAALEILYASETGLTSIDVSGLTKLNYLNVIDCNNLTTITANGCTSLESIYSSYDYNFPSLTSISLVGNTAMTSFSAFGEQIESIDLSNCTGLTSVSVYDRKKLTSLKLDGCTGLQSVNVSTNESLESFAVSGAAELESLYLPSNDKLSSISLKDLPGLKYLSVNGNPALTAINVKGLAALENLDASETGLTSIDASGLTKLNYLNVINCNNLTTITANGCTSLEGISSSYDIYFPSLTSISLVGNTAMTSFSAFGENIESIDLSDCTGLTDVYVYDKKKLTSLKLDGCTGLQIVNVTTNESLEAFTISGAAKLTDLNLQNNDKLSSISLKDLPGVKTLSINGNPALTAIDVSGLTALETLYASNSGLTSIDVSGLTKLTHFDVANCVNLTTITANGCTSLESIYYFGDYNFPSLKSLSLVGNPAMTNLWIYGEQIESVDLSNSTFTSLDVSSRNKLTSLTLTGCTIENLNIWNNEILKGVDLSEVNVENVQIQSNPVLDHVNLGEGKQLVSATITSNPMLETLVVKSPTLTNLNCGSNGLTTLDVSNCPALETLDCSYNQLAQIDVTKNTNLISLVCAYNQLTSLDLSKNTKLEYSNTYQNIEAVVVKLSAKEVGLTINDSFDPNKFVAGSLYIEGSQKEPKFITVDDIKYMVIYDNAADCEDVLKDKYFYYGYDTGREGHALNLEGYFKSFTKAPSFLKVAPESVKGTFGAALAAPTLTRSQDYNGTVTYASADQSVVKVASDGKLTVVGAGETTVTLTGVETEYRLAPAAITYGVTIEKASPVFKFASATQEMKITDAVPANALDKGVYDGKVVYASSDEKVAKIDANGKITIVAAGEVTFTASGEATKNCNAPTAASYKLTIKKLTATLSVASASIEGVYGATLTAPALTLNGYDGTPTYKSSDEKVVKVAADGKLTVIGAGEATITISGAATAKYYAPADVTYKVKIAKAQPQFAFANAEITAYMGGAVPENKLNKGVYDGKVVYSTSNAAIADVNAETGAVTMKKTGEVTITATGAETSNCKAVTASYKLTVAAKKGDVNLDGVVDTKDVLEITNAMSGNPSEKYDKKNADLNKDNKVDIADVIIVVNEIKK